MIAVERVTRTFETPAGDFTVTASQKLQTPVAYQDAGEFNAWWKKDAEKLAAVIKKIGKLEGAR